jgi:hypothetical protein
MSTMIAAVAADPYSSHKTQLGTCQGPPNAYEYQTKKTGRMLSVHTTSGSVNAAGSKKGSSQTKYHG